MKESLRKLVEYKVYYIDGNVDHVDWRTAKRMARSPSADIKAISRVTRWWHREDGSLEREDEEFYLRR